MRLLCLFALLCALPSSSPGAVQPYRGKDYRVEHYEAELAPDLASRSLRGNVSIRIRSAVASLPVVALDADGLVIEKATEDGRALNVDVQPGLANIRLARPARRGEPRTLRIWYHAEPKRGMTFLPEGWWFTAFHTEAWLPCDASPADRSTFTIHWTVPATLDLIGTGDETERHKVAGDLERRTVRLDEPYPAYLVGAVAGPLRTTCTDAGPSASAPRSIARQRSTFARHWKWCTARCRCSRSGLARRFRGNATTRSSFRIAQSDRSWSAWRWSARASFARWSRIRERTGWWSTS